MIFRQHVTPDRRLLLAVCDSELKGKKIESKGVMLDLSADFYDGEEMQEDEVIKLMKVAALVNLVGENSVSLGIKSEVIEKENVILVSGVPHAQWLVVRED